MSTVWEDTDGLGQRVTWMPGASDATGQPLQWAASTADKEPWLELELRERSTVTGQGSKVVTSSVSLLSLAWLAVTY